MYEFQQQQYCSDVQGYFMRCNAVMKAGRVKKTP